VKNVDDGVKGEDDGVKGEDKDEVVVSLDEEVVLVLCLMSSTSPTAAQGVEVSTGAPPADT
jgi:hypothetical protein